MGSTNYRNLSTMSDLEILESQLYRRIQSHRITKLEVSLKMEYMKPGNCQWVDSNTREMLTNVLNKTLE